MADQKSPNEQDQDLNPSSGQEPALRQEEMIDSVDAETATPVSNRTGKAAAWLSSLLALVALLIAVGVAWLGHQQAQESEQQINRLQQELQQALQQRPTHQQLQEPLAALFSLNQLQQSQQQLSEQTLVHQQQLKEMQLALTKASEPRPRDWQLAEVEYLLRLANQRLQLEEDVSGALTLFQTAEQRLKAADVPGTLSIRSLLLDDIAKLKSVTAMDRVSLALELQDMADEALLLQVQPLPEAPVIQLNQLTDTSSEQTWYQRLWQEIRSLVVVRKRELPVQALPFTEDELALRHQLSALLLQASWAGLRAEDALYLQSLARAEQRLQGFDRQATASQQMLKRVQQLQQQSVRQTLPDTESSLDSLQTFIAQRYSTPLPVVPEATAPAAVQGEQP
ncbi:MAG: uroporphyrinogen-III C-methyltransferase [Marinospirillum sp.]|uniref:uroporphyrinogen-III C-methyltransferase n=1 Tax=Marinospirillum sp. TaxID=2183934 RepID=UPI0019F253FB|nr:uroporphyrinogen-III C-methyltransferase [Marinospirillum sp.]MBE0506413.1 uroporphyrinogen-III C-methyltransferase [Marinospirillum sp.]